METKWYIHIIGNSARDHNSKLRLNRTFGNTRSVEITCFKINHNAAGRSTKHAEILVTQRRYEPFLNLYSFMIKLSKLTNH